MSREVINGCTESSHDLAIFMLAPGAMGGTWIWADSQRSRAPMAAPGLAGSRRGFWLLGLLAFSPVAAAVVGWYSIYYSTFYITPSSLYILAISGLL